RASAIPTQSQLFRKPLSGGAAVPLTTDEGGHSAAFSKGHSGYGHGFSSLHSIPKATVHKADGAVVGDLPSGARHPPVRPMAEVAKGGDGEGLYASVVRPRDFGPGKKYPVIDHVYGGPGHNQVAATMGMHLLDQWLADQGFVVVSIDGRGTPGRGRNWERV